MKHIDIPYDPHNANSFRQIMAQVLRLLLMRHWIEQARRIPPFINAGRHAREVPALDHSMIGYRFTHQMSSIQRQVVNIGLSIKHITTEPRGVPVIESIAHKLTPTKIQLLAREPDNEVARCAACASSSMFLVRPRALTVRRRLPGGSSESSSHVLLVHAAAGSSRRITEEIEIMWYESAKDLESWVQFINID
ncbi:hypothetical protein FB451DRAFT_1164444 [Mycena latifolia]|nr:hypothetical protein FB451DRAFT_1164444 [Mycena latifolia]